LTLLRAATCNQTLALIVNRINDLIRKVMISGDE